MHSNLHNLEALTAEHPYREPIWAELMTAYYLTDRQSDALETYRRVNALLQDDLGIDPGPTLRDLHARVLHQDRLDAKSTAMTTAAIAITTIDQHTLVDDTSGIARLRQPDGRCFALLSAVTTLGRAADNDIVLEDESVSRQHAVIVDTGTSFVITDRGSVNGVQVQHKPIRPSATLADGDHIGIGAHEFTFEIGTAVDRGA